MSVKIKARTGRTADIQQAIGQGPSHFAMVEKVALHNLDELMQKDMQAARLIVSLIRLLEPGSGGVIVISRPALAELMEVSLPTVQRALKTLVDGKWVQRMRIGSAYALVVNDAVAWVGPRGDRRHAVFSATVVAARSEQDEAALNPGELRRLPVMNHGEALLPSGDEPAPPAQGMLSGTEPVAIRGADQDVRDELERHGQQRISE